MKLKRFLIESKVWLDDERPSPKGWIHFKTVPELIKFYEKNYSKITELSLDHDLGEGTPEGYEFLKWLEEKMFHKKFDTLPKIKVHSANPVGRKRMEQTIKAIEGRL